MAKRVKTIALAFAAGVGVLFALLAADAIFLGRCAAKSASPGRPAWAARFAIADFDGDLKPDIATVEVENERHARTNYWIRLQLSAGLGPAVPVKGPAGGVSLAARDVNGDQAPDLIVSSISGAHVVAVLLNDGHGRFSAGEVGDSSLPLQPDAFFREPHLLSGDTVSLAQPRFTFDGLCAAAGAVCPGPASHSLRLNKSSAVAVSSENVPRGRAPPNR